MTTPAPRPHSTSFSLSPSPAKHGAQQRRPNSLSSPGPKRQPLGAISVQTFQDRHRTEFAHLHTHSNDSLREKRLEAEKAELERARREGREKRESLKAAKLAAELAGRENEGKGRRPLSLVVKQSSTGGEKAGTRPNSAPLGLLSPRASIRGGRGSLNVVVEGDTVAQPTTTSITEDGSPADYSVSHSSYSWASQFSGETEELRTAARYIPKPSDHEAEEEEEQEELQDDEEEILASSPEQGVYRRRKKIVALAHTVRQLEGVGSREAEDPAFYAVLEKAWNERPLGTAATPALGGPGTASSDNGSSPYTPNLTSRHSDGNASYAKDDADATSFASSARRSNSVRYSYASTLHDLALDGGIEQADRIFLAKPWLRASVVSTSPGDKAFGSNFTSKPRPRQEYATGDIRRLSLASSPPPFASAPAPGLAPTATGLSLASPITLQRAENHQDNAKDLPVSALRKDGDNYTASNDKKVVDAAEPNTGSSAPTWGLGFVSDWFGAPNQAAETAKAPGADANANAAVPSIARSTTVAQFDDAPNDDSLVDADGETDDGEYDYASEGEPEQVFHEREGTGEPLDPSPDRQHIHTDETETRPESTILPSRQETESQMAKDQDLLHSKVDPDSSITSDPSSLGLDRSITSTTDINVNINASPSLNPSQPLICSTHSITSYQPTLVHLGLGLGLSTGAEQQHQQQQHPEGQTAVIEEHPDELGSCRSSVSCSYLSKRTRDSTGSTKSTKSAKPVLAPIQTTLDRLEAGSSTNPTLLPDNKETETLKVHLADERFSNAYKLAQSIRVPTPSIKSPIRQSSINVLSPILSPTTTPEMQVSSRWFSQDSSEDAELMMGGGIAPSPSPTTLTRPLGPARTRSSSTSIVTSPAQMSPNTPGGNQAKSLRRPSRPNLLDTRAPTLSSISELGIGSALAPSDTLNSISAGSEVLTDSPDLAEDLSIRRSRLAQTSLDSLPSYLRPPSISDSISSSSVGGGRRTSNYQAYQQRHLERNRRANARVAAKMAGASAKELKQLQIQQHQSMILGTGSPNPGGKLESQSIMIVPEPSRTACALFFLGFFLGPWFWIFGGWMPMGHSSEIRKDEEASLDFTAADHLPRGWRWTYHPDPWVKRNRRAAAIVIPLLVVGGVAAAIAVAVVFGAA